MEVLAAAGMTVTIPPALSAAYSAVLQARRLYNSVQRNKTELELLLTRCSQLLLKVAEQLDSGVIKSTLENLLALESACVSVHECVSQLVNNGFLWSLLHKEAINENLSAAERTVTHAFRVFNFVMQTNLERLHDDMNAARRADNNELYLKLQELSHNDHTLLAAIPGEDQHYRKLEEFAIGLSKYIQIHGCHVQSNAEPEETFIRAAAAALQRISKCPMSMVPHWVVTNLEVSIDRTDGNCIGRGSFGRIYRGNWNGLVVAVKEMHSEDAQSLNNHGIKAIRAEVEIWSRLAHPHILQFFGACLEASQPFLVNKFCANGNVIAFLRSHPRTDRIRLLDEISRGMTYLHGQNIIHANLKGVNVLIGDDQKALITDFGISRLQDDIFSARSGRSPRPSGPVNGTLRWMSPQCLNGEHATKASDVYSFAITAWEIFTGEVPFGINERVLCSDIVDRQLRPERPSNMPDDALWELVVSCWTHDPKLRPNFRAIHVVPKSLLERNNAGLDANERQGGVKGERRPLADEVAPVKDRKTDSDKTSASSTSSHFHTFSMPTVVPQIKSDVQMTYPPTLLSPLHRISICPSTPSPSMSPKCAPAIMRRPASAGGWPVHEHEEHKEIPPLCRKTNIRSAFSKKFYRPSKVAPQSSTSSDAVSGERLIRSNLLKQENTDLVQQLRLLGFSENQARIALESQKNDLKRAINSLLWAMK